MLTGVWVWGSGSPFEVVAINVLYLSSKYTFVISLLLQKLESRESIFPLLSLRRPKTRKTVGLGKNRGKLQLECQFLIDYWGKPWDLDSWNGHSSCKDWPRSTPSRGPKSGKTGSYGPSVTQVRKIFFLGRSCNSKFLLQGHTQTMTESKACENGIRVATFTRKKIGGSRKSSVSYDNAQM